MLQHWSWCISTKHEGSTRAHPESFRAEARTDRRYAPPCCCLLQSAPPTSNIFRRLCFVGCSASEKPCITTIIFMAYLPAIFQSHWKFWESITLPNPTASPKCHIPTAIPYTTSRRLISTAFAMFKAALLLLAGSDTHLLGAYTYRDITQTIHYRLCYCIAISNFLGVVKLVFDRVHAKTVSGEPG